MAWLRTMPFSGHIRDVHRAGMLGAIAAAWVTPARHRRRMLARADRGDAVRITGAVRRVEGDAPRALYQIAQRRFRARPFALESDEGELVLVDPTHGFASEQLRSVGVGDRVTVLGTESSRDLRHLIPERRGYRDVGAPRTLTGSPRHPLFVE